MGVLIQPSGTPPEAPGSSPWKIPVNQFVRDALIPLLQHRVAEVRVITSKDELKDQENAVYVSAELTTSRQKYVAVGSWGYAGTLGVTLTISVATKDKVLWERKYENDGDFYISGAVPADDIRFAEYNKTVNAALVKSLDAGVRHLFSDRDVIAGIEKLPIAQARALGDMLNGLQTYLATFRVSEAEGVIRKQPNSNAGTVKTVGMGSIVQIIGKLPTGWLQVAREGEAIGWIHESSVAVLNVQPAAQVAQAVAPAPSKIVPSRPAPVEPAPVVAETFPSKPVAVTFPRGKPNPDDIAIIIGNANYKATAKDIPDVVPAYADAEGMKRYALQALGIKEENVIFIKDGRLTDFVATFGNDSNHKGKLFNWVKAGKSNVFIYYSGHGAPSADGSSSYLVPVDAQGSLIALSAYPLRTLYANLAKLPAISVTVVLESCFSGSSQSGTVIKNASPVFQKALQETVPPNLTVISAASGTQIASWEQDKSSGLFTKYFLLGMAGAADKKPYGNSDGKVTHEELARYLAETVSYSAQRYYGREQTAQILTGGR
jgi:hypothetical protein